MSYKLKSAPLHIQRYYSYSYNQIQRIANSIGNLKVPEETQVFGHPNIISP